MQNRVAIITPCYNTPYNLIHKHFLSIRKQHRDDILHVVVDDASTDVDTRAALLHECDKNKENTVLIASKVNSGPGAARNRAIEYLKTQNGIRYVCLLDADDYFEDSAIVARKAVLEDNPDLIAVYGDKYTADWEIQENPVSGEEELLENEKLLENISQYDKARLHRECYIPSCSVMFRWQPFRDLVGSFHEDVRLCEDWLVWRKLSLLGRFKKLNMPIYTQTMHGTNLTTNPAVLENHLADMIATQEDLKDWMNRNMDKITL